MSAFYPANLNYENQRAGFKLSSLGLPAMKSPMQSGKVRMRPQYTLRISVMDVSIHFTPEELGRFLFFVNNEIGEGTGEFTMLVWVSAENQYAPRLVQIKDAVEGISYEPFGAEDTLVSFSLNVRNL